MLLFWHLYEETIIDGEGIHMYNSQGIREQILILLEEKSLSISKMLDDCGYNRNLVDDMKNGKMPSADKIVTIAQYLDVSVAYLMGAKEQSERILTYFNSKGKTDREILELIMIYQQLNTQNRQQLMEYIKFLYKL